MKKIYTLLFALMMTSLGFSQGTETFSDLPSNGTYLSRTWTGDDGSTWTATNSRTDQDIDGRAITMNDDKSNTYVQSGTISGGIGDITITTQRKYSGGSGSLDVLINGSSVGTIPYSGSAVATTISGINISGDIVIRIDNNIGGSNGGGADRVAVDNITWTAAGPTCTAPTTQASLYNTTALGTTSATLNWTYGDGEEVLVVVKEGSAVDTDPTSGTDYTGNTVFGSGDELGTGNYVVHSESATSSVSITGLTEATTYHVAVYEYNTTDTCYLTPALTGSFTTECSTPSEVNTFTATAGNEEVDLTWSNGSCYDEILVIAKETSAVTVTPTGDGSAYTANTAFGSGSDVGSSEFVVYKGTGTSATVTGLTNGNTYHFSVFTRKATSWSAAVVDDATLDCTAPAIQASTFTTLSPTTTDVSIEFTRGGGDDVLVVMKEGSAVDTDPTSGISYNANSIFNGAGASEIGTGNYVVFNGNNGTSNPGTGGSSLSISVSGLNPNTTYHLAIYEYNTTNTCYNLIEFTGDFTTVCSTPSDVTAFTATASTTDVDLSWTNGSCYDDILVVAKEVSAVSVTPTGDGTAYIADAAFGSGTDLGTGEYAVYKGSGTSVTITGLNFGTTYHFKVFARKDTTWSSGVTDNATPNYCDPNPSSVDGTGITNVNIGTINNSTGVESGNYGDYSAQSTDVIQGQTVACDITFTTGYAYNTKIWIDYNNDGDFDDLDEEVYSGMSASESTTTLNASFTVPLTATLGQHRLRIGSSEGEGFGGTVIPCYTGPYGAYEDYTINILVGNDNDTEVYDPTSQVAATTITAASSTTSGTAFDAFGFEVGDQGTTDGEPTNITTMRFVPGPNNTADWTDHIQGVTLSDENAVSYAPTTSITDTEIVLTFGSPIAVADGTSLKFLLGLYLNETAIVDGSVIQLQINESASGFATDIMGSGFADPFLLGDVVGNDITINVYATELMFSEQASDTELNAAMSPAVTVSGVDANGNLDTDYNLDVDITSTGTLSGSPVTATAVSGIATFSTLTHTIVGSGLVLTADDGALATVDSSSFDITEPIVGAADLFFSEYVEGNTGNNKYLEIYNGTGTTITLTDYSVEMYSNGSSSASQTEDFTVGFPTTLASGDVIVLRAQNTSEFNGTAYDSGVCFFNGDDTVVLKKHGIIIDIIGNIGCDPGSGFNATGGNSTLNQSLIRNTDVCEGVSIDPSGCGSTSFTTLATEWTSLGTDVFSNLGSHSAMCGPTTYTYTGTWSPSNPNGVATANDNIVITSGAAIIDTNTTANSVTVSPGASLTVNSSVTLTVNSTEGLLLNSTSTSYSSLILDGTIAGTVKYNRYVNYNDSVNGNDLISAPLSGQAFNTFIANNPNIRANPSGPEVLFGGFDNNSSTDPFELWNDTDTTPLTAGKGYRSGITEGQASNLVTFEGTVNTSLVQIPINQGSESTLNLIGNPFPSYLDAQEFLSHNSGLLDPSAAVIYGYNDSTDGTSADDYTIISALLNTSMNIAPGQAFFVSSNTTGGNIEFTTSGSDMRLATGGDDFIAGRNSSVISNLKLNLSNTNANFITDIFFTQYSTQGLDPGYDASLLGGVAPAFALYSHLVEDNTDVPLAVQALGKTDYMDITIPLGVNANQGEQIIFSINETNLANTVEVYLEDNVTNTSTLLNTSDYTLTPNVDLNGTGRFYLRVTDNSLSISDNSLDNLNIYNNQKDKTVVISGQLAETTTAKLYDIQGRTVSTSLLQNLNSLQTIDVSGLKAGVYVVQLVNGTQNKTQKIIIR
ncbi:GEVED domain-containing protein [Winogradskyella sp. ECml5-4]|uniref:beta strand repeat-containing protein n=1 Tax=Winogradskyella sp. ECml5-4 TaxID=3110975 RepID=UPI002FF1EF75